MSTRSVHSRTLAAASVVALGCFGLGAIPAAAEEKPGRAASPGQSQSAGSDKPKPDKPEPGQPNLGKPNPGNSNSGQGNPNPGQGNPNPGNPNPGQGNPNPGQGNPNPGQGNPNAGNPNAGNAPGSPANAAPDRDPAPAETGQGNDNGNANGNAKGNGKGNGKDKGGQGDPAGNNGTVKITPVGEDDGIPQNSPHPGCSFQVEWYGFDEGEDVLSTVSFAMQAPTGDVDVSVDGPATVFVGGDPASGAGTDTGLDGQAVYTLSFAGEPHPKQGYHVKLTVATQRSQGSDTKTKVFWVAPCDDAATDGGPSTGSGFTPDSEVGGTSDGSDAASLGADGALAPTGSGVLGTLRAPDEPRTLLTPDESFRLAAGDGTVAVPTSIEAGSRVEDVVAAATSPVGLLVILLGIAAGVGAVALRRRHVV